MSNHKRVGKALEILKAGLPAFVERELNSAHGTRWLATAKPVIGLAIQIGRTEKSPDLDAAGLLRAMWECWNDGFGKHSGVSPGRSVHSVATEAGLRRT